LLAAFTRTSAAASGLRASPVAPNALTTARERNPLGDLLMVPAAAAHIVNHARDARIISRSLDLADGQPEQRTQHRRLRR